MHLPSRRRLLRRAALAFAAPAIVALFIPSGTPPHSQPRSTQQAPAITDSAFWHIFATMSEPGGGFVSENFVSNEITFQHVIPTLQKSLTKDGVYLGVGPEQNFTYIANLQPRMAVIFDIRRQNALLHLMYKSIFELSPTRAEFVATLFSRPQVAKLGIGISAKALFDSAAVAAPSDSAFLANRKRIVERLTQTHRFALTPEDLGIIERVYRVFYDAGPDINYGQRTGSPSYQSRYPSYGTLQSATNADSVPLAFLGAETQYRIVRDMQLRNLIVPVVGNFAGTKAIREVGEYLRKQRATVTTFYVSNVEQYLFRSTADFEQFYANVSLLPIDSTSRFIRSVPPGGADFIGGPQFRVLSPGGGSAMLPPNTNSSFSITIVDSGGMRVMRVVRDSAGQVLTGTFVDSAGRVVPRTAVGRALSDSATVRADSVLLGLIRAITDTTGQAAVTRYTIAPTIFQGGFGLSPNSPVLVSGLASMKETLDSFFTGNVRTYNDVIGMTRTDGWRQNR